MIHHERVLDNELMFCFMASEQLEPIAVLVVVHREHGRLERLEPAHIPLLETAVQQFTRLLRNF